MGGTVRLVQLQRGTERRVALVDEPYLRLLNEWTSVFGLVQSTLREGASLAASVRQYASEDILRYDPIYNGTSEWQLVVPIDHPSGPGRTLVSGTGLTHLGSAKDRNTMHLANESELTDSMKMFRWGVEGGRPLRGQVGIAPEWFYKGDGNILKSPGEPLIRPSFAEDGGEEGEIVGVYVIDSKGLPRRIGMCIGNEFADHKFEKRNYLNLAGSKMRTCSIGPELVVDPDFSSVSGKVTIERGSDILWTKEVASGEAEMCHSLQNIEHHHFKFDPHRQPGDIHVHYFGACSISYGAGIELADQDVMEISFIGFGRPLRNPLSFERGPDRPITVASLA